MRRLRDLKLCDDATVTATAERWWFGRLVANADMHTGNLSLQPQGRAGAPARLGLAPSYDRLPMLHAPLPGGELPLRTFNSPGPLPGERVPWQAATQAARLSWAWAAQVDRVSAGFRQLAQSGGQAVERAAASAGT